MPTTIIRYVLSFFAALVVVFSLFWVMQYLIASADRTLDEDDAGHLLEFVRIKQDEAITPRKLKPKKPPPPEEAPPDPPPPALDNITPDAQAVAVTAVSINTRIDLSASGFGLSPSDGDYLPIVKVQPMYPRRALTRGIEGYVIVMFTVTRQGTTRDHVIVESKPRGIFDRAALRAATKFKYKPRIVDGQPIEVPGVKNKITFLIED